jgi:hypothetical protein
MRLGGLLAIAGTATLAAVAGAATPANPVPATVVTSFRATFLTNQGTEELAWQAPERFSSRPVRATPYYGRIVTRGGTFYARFAGSPTSIFTRTFGVRPDGYPEIERVRGATDYVLGAQRGGRQVLVPASLGGRPAYRATVPLPANDCAGLPRGNEELWIDRETFLPLRMVERRGGTVRRMFRLSYRDRNRPLPGAFTPIPPGRNPNRQDEGFVRTSPAAAARRLSYRPQLPASVPDGFELAVSGWAPMSRETGAEGANPRYRQLFAAVYMRGLERIDFTMRLAGDRGWIDDPFGAECVSQEGSSTRIRGVPAFYAGSPQIVPHLYWQRGRILYALSGPLSKTQLVELASSLRPI